MPTCPICLGNQGVESNETMLLQQDLVFRDDLVSVWVNSKWIPGNEGHVIVVSNEHFENIYSIPENVGNRIFQLAQRMSLILKLAYKCDGITLRQNNEPAGDQHAMHFHLHVFPRYLNDQFNKGLTQESILANFEERKYFADMLLKKLAE